MEIIDIIDMDDNVIGKAPKDECHKKGYLHRSVFIFLFDKNKNMILQKRSSKKKIRPNKITAAACGHVVSGEDTYTAACRELEEELGIKFKNIYFTLKTLGPYEHDRELIFLYIGETDMKIIPNKEEVDDVLYLSIDEIKEGIKNKDINLGKSFIKVFNEFLKTYEY